MRRKKKKKNMSKRKERSSSSSSSISSSSSETSGGRRKKKKKHSSRGRRHKSGKTRKCTSYVKYPQKWPHTYLSLHYISKNKNYEELSIPEFCAGVSLH